MKCDVVTGDVKGYSLMTSTLVFINPQTRKTRCYVALQALSRA